MQLFGLDITGDHARIIFAALGGVAAATGFVAGRWSKHRDWMLFKSEDLVTPRW